MRSFFKLMFTVLLIPCLLCSGCAKSIKATVYIFDGYFLKAKSVNIAVLAADNLVSALKEEGVVTAESNVQGFENAGSDTYRCLKIDLNAEFYAYLNGLDNSKQLLTMQSVANTFLKNYSADEIGITVDGAPVITEYYDFTAPLTYLNESVSVESLVMATPEAPVETPVETPVPTETPTEVPTQTAPPTATVKPTPYITPTRPDGKKYVALTFDDGPHKKYTRMIVDKLKEYNTGATFFIIGNRVDAETGAAIKYAYDNGSEIAIHGYTHQVYYNSCSEARFEEELSKTRDVIQQYVGAVPTMMRPIGGSITNARVKSCGYSVILWNVDSEDWKHKKNTQSEIDAIVHNVMSTVRDGSIILMHEIYENSYQAFVIIMQQLYAQGYEVVTVSELLGKENITPGSKYYGG